VEREKAKARKGRRSPLLREEGEERNDKE